MTLNSVRNAIVGHGLPTYCRNRVETVLTSSDDLLLVVDNASPEVEVREGRAERDEDDTQHEGTRRVKASRSNTAAS